MIVCPDVSGVHWSDFGHLEECVRAGEQAISSEVEEIQKRIAGKKIRKIMRFPFSWKKNPPISEDEICANLSR